MQTSLKMSNYQVGLYGIAYNVICPDTRPSFQYSIALTMTYV